MQDLLEQILSIANSALPEDNMECRRALCTIIFLIESEADINPNEKDIL